MSTKKELYRSRKEKGLCVKCGKVPPRENKVMCAECAEKERKYENETRAFCRSVGICPVCQKNKLFGDERNCPECRAKNYARNLKQPKTIRRINTTYYKRKKLGLCVKCGDKPPEYNKTMCKRCLIKEQNRAKDYRAKQAEIPRNERIAYGLCYICGEKLDRYGSLCKKCSDRVTKNFGDRDKKISFSFGRNLYEQVNANN